MSGGGHQRAASSRFLAGNYKASRALDLKERVTCGLFGGHFLSSGRQERFLLIAPDSRLFLAIPYRAGELRQHAIEYETRIPPGIFVRHFSIHAQKRIAIFFE
jgi:hypothetical protein